MTMKDLLLAVCLSMAFSVSTACSRSPADREARFLQRGKDFVAKKDYTRAAIEFQNASKTMPKDAEPYYQLALLALQRRDARGAIALLRKATDLNAQHAGAQLKLATMMLASSDDETAQTGQERIAGVISKTPHDPE